jgi:hypothetical protein
MEYFVASNTVIGTAGGTVGQWALDFGARDERAPALQWANQARWENGAGDIIYTACVSDAYEATLKLTLEGRFGKVGNPRTTPPVCGTIEQDIPGTAQGVWFLSTADVNSIYPEDPHIALVHDNYDPSQGVLSIGTSVPDASGKHLFTPTAAGAVNREFSGISHTDSTIYCYPLQPSGALLLQMAGETSLNLEYQSNDCTKIPNKLTDSAVLFIR